MRRALWAVVTLLAFVSIACGGGTDEMSNDSPTAGTTAGTAGLGGMAGGTAGTAGASASTCGDGRIDMMKNENCEPSIPHGLSCAGLGMGSGMVLCSSTCRLMMMCTGDMSMGGNGGGGNGG